MKGYEKTMEIWEKGEGRPNLANGLANRRLQPLGHDTCRGFPRENGVFGQ